MLEPTAKIRASDRAAVGGVMVKMIDPIDPAERLPLQALRSRMTETSLRQGR